MALSFRRSWRSAGSVALLASLMQPLPRPVLECVLPDDPSPRTYQVLDYGAAREPRFALRLTGGSLGAERVDLPLANARVERGERRLTISSVSGNGGASVQIAAVDGSGASTIDVFVNYELEVNVWRDLSPDVAHMNTQGPQANAQCRVLSIPEGMPYHR
jgi:hypothetical protein